MNVAASRCFSVAGTRAPRVAIVHYWLVAMRGGERVLERLLSLYPQADIFTHVFDPNAVSPRIRAAKVTTTFINRLPLAHRWYQYYLPLMPLALEQLDLRGYDLVISSESGPAKGIITDPSSMHLCYCHSPMRYLWDHYHLYRRSSNPLVNAITPVAYHMLRQWDVSSSARVDRVIANSTFIRDRIRKNWRRESDIVHPPVDTSLFRISDEIEDHYLWVGQMVAYKRPDLVVDAFNRNGKRLLMVGRGPMLKKIRARAMPNIRIVEQMSFDDLRRAYARARALVFTAEEDFGIVPVEALASGRPVLAFGRGGVIDSIDPNINGLFFAAQEADALLDGVDRMEAWLPHFDPAAAVAKARQFAPERFDTKIRAIIAS